MSGQISTMEEIGEERIYWWDSKPSEVRDYKYPGWILVPVHTNLMKSVSFDCDYCQVFRLMKNGADSGVRLVEVSF